MSAADPVPSATQHAADASRGPLSGGVGIFVFIALFGAAAFLTYRTLTTAPIPPAEPLKLTFYCVEARKPFDYDIKEGEKWPIVSPYTGKATGYPAEKCYWTKDGKRTEEPTYVVLNETLGKSGDTICPVCGRLVIGHNPMPDESVPLAGSTTQPAAPPTTQSAGAD
ncbi:MAG: hypothetical protein DCC65_12400 [Planctomycetota bacterium]|nr:MAG: hypothetical protein DCC65_12400 [Planctomycetota bacterium]